MVKTGIRTHEHFLNTSRCNREEIATYVWNKDALKVTQIVALLQ
jgi:hypothetical protein